MATLQCYIVVFLALDKISECVTGNRRVLEKFIVGGEFTTIDKFPHAVYLSMRCSDTGSHYACGASIVNQGLVITAAHCVALCDLAKHRMYCYVGHEDVYKASVHEVQNFKYHDKYIEEKLVYDIALATIEAISLGDNIKRIIIPSSYPENLKNKKVSIAGWGSHGDKKESKQHFLKSADRIMRDFEYCKRVLGTEIDTGSLCAGERLTTNRPTFGDSGGGLIYKSVLLGIVSYGVSNHLGLDVFTNVTYHYPWIKKTAETLYCENNSSEVITIT